MFNFFFIKKRKRNILLVLELARVQHFLKPATLPFLYATPKTISILHYYSLFFSHYIITLLLQFFSIWPYLLLTYSSAPTMQFIYVFHLGQTHELNGSKDIRFWGILLLYNRGAVNLMMKFKLKRAFKHHKTTSIFVDS